jgi:hypothetical protein
MRFGIFYGGPHGQPSRVVMLGRFLASTAIGWWFLLLYNVGGRVYVISCCARTLLQSVADLENQGWGFQGNMTFELNAYSAKIKDG